MSESSVLERILWLPATNGQRRYTAPKQLVRLPELLYRIISTTLSVCFESNVRVYLGR